MIRLVISSQTCVSCLMYRSVSRTVSRWPRAHLSIELVGQRFQVHVRSVHVAVELGPRLRADLTGGDGYRANALFVTGRATSIAYSWKMTGSL